MATSGSSKLPSTNRPMLTIEGDNGNVIRVVDHDGRIYIEAQGKHDGAVTYTLVVVDRLRFVPAVLGWFA